MSTLDVDSDSGMLCPAEFSSLRTTLWAAIVALFWTALSFWLIGDLYLNLRDEGYLWYGVEALGRGEVPFRDFQSYDPGRYYWCRFWGLLFGQHVLGMRAGLALFQGLGLALGLACMRRLFGGTRWLWPLGLLFLLWMFPRFKVFEASITLVGLWSLTRLIELPDIKRYALAGLSLGLAAFFGRNHGLYLGAANLGLFVFLFWKGRAHLAPRRLLGWVLGVLLGYAPMLGMLAFVPGFASAFWRELLATAQRGANQPRDFPWPWKFHGAGLEGMDLVGAWVEQSAFLLPLVALPLGLWALLRLRPDQLRSRAVLVAATLLSLPYAHHYAVRSDLPHLAQAVLPLLVILLAVGRWNSGGRAWVRHALLALLLAQGVLIGLFKHPTFKQFQPGRERPALALYSSAGCELRLKSAQARLLTRLGNLLERYVKQEPLFIAPTHTTYYPLFQKDAPAWWIYFLFQSTEAEQLQVIERLEAGQVRWALIDEKSFAKDVSYDFRNTNPLVWEHFMENWVLIQDRDVPPGYFLFKRQ